MLRSLIVTPLHLALSFLTIWTLVVTILLFLSLDRHPLIATHWQPSEDEIARAKQILDNFDLLDTPSKAARTLILTDKELNTAAGFLLSRTIADGAAHVALAEHACQLTVSVPLPPNPMGSFANFRLWLHEDKGIPVIGRLQIGRLSINPEYTAWLLEMIIEYSPQARFYGLANTRIKKLRIAPNSFFISYTWHRQPGQGKPDITSGTNDELLAIYQDKLVEVTRQPGLKQQISLSVLLQPLAIFAQKRSMQGHAIDENRALILVLNDYINGNMMGRPLPLPKRTDAPAQHTVLLNGRADLARHFIASAALAASGHNALANLIGLYKEMNDAKSGSGFSFSDLTADQAGTRFGEMAVNSIADAKKLQYIMRQNAIESVYMPDTKALPENLSGAEFEGRFGAVGSPEFEQLMVEIKQRIAACPLYQQKLNEKSMSRQDRKAY